MIYIITRTDTRALLLKTNKQTNKQTIIKNILGNSGIVVNLRPGRRELRDNLRNKRRQNKEVVKRTRLKAGKGGTDYLDKPYVGSEKPKSKRMLHVTFNKILHKLFKWRDSHFHGQFLGYRYRKGRAITFLKNLLTSSFD